jgi:Ca2+-transporting ATPase
MKPSVRMLLRIGNLCNNSNLDAENSHGSPTEVALLELLKRTGGGDERGDGFVRVAEVPFNTERKFMAVKCEGKDGALFYVKGGMEAVLSRCGRVYMGEGDNARVLTPALTQSICESTEKVSKEGGLRVLFMAVGKDVERDLALVGFVAMADPIRRGVPGAIRKLISGGVKVVMITGDSRMFISGTYIVRDHCRIYCWATWNPHSCICRYHF